MTKRIHNVTKWKKLENSKGIAHEGMPNRLIRIDFNTMLPTAVMLVGEGDKHTFLGMVSGLDAIEFRAPTELVHVIADSEGEVWYFTNDGRKVAGDVSDQVTFTDIMSREKRNPQQDLMMWQMQQNAKRREQSLLAEIQRRDADEAERQRVKDEADATAAAAAAAEEAAAATAKAATEAAAKVPAGA